MRELIGRVAITDGTTASALQVIAHFDALADQRSSTGSVLRAVAALADCTVCLHHGALGSSIRVDPAGRTLPADEPPDPCTEASRQVIDREQASTMWLERCGAPGPLDQLILERAAQVLRPLLRTSRSAAPNLDAAVRIACDPLVTGNERAAALHALGVDGEALVVVTPPSHRPLSGPTVLTGGIWALLLPVDAEPEAHLSAGGRAGIAATTEGNVVEALAKATTALELAVDWTAGGPVHVRFDTLGDIAALVHLLPDRCDTPDARRIEALRQARPWVPGTIYHALGHQSLRQAASALHIHHSTLHQRIAWLDQELGYSLRDPIGRLRAATAWTLWRCSGAGADKA